MNELKIFENPKFGKIRTIEENGEVLFCGSDVAKALGYARPNEAIAAHCKGTVKRRTPTNGGMQEMLFIPRGDVFRLAANSKLEGAAEFESWIFDIIVPSVYEHGGYIAGQGEMTPEQLISSALVVANSIINEQKRLIETQRPLVEFAQHVGEASNAISVGDFAKLLIDEHIEIGQNRLFAWLKRNKYLQKDNMPYQRYMDAGYFKVIEQTYDTPYGKKTSIKTLVTGKGQIYFTEKLRTAGEQYA